MKSPLLRSSVAVIVCALVFTLVGCAQYAAVAPAKPRLDASKALATSAPAIENALRVQKRKPLDCLGGLLAVAQDAAARLEKNPDDAAARATYNFAVSRIVRTIQKSGLTPWPKPLVVPGPGGNFLLTNKPDPNPRRNPSLYDFVPADEFAIKGTYVSEKSIRTGIGAPLVVISKENVADFRKEFWLPRTYYGVTAVLRFQGRRAELAFYDPLATEEIRFGQRTVPLAADFTVPLAVMLASTNPKKLEISRLLNPDKYADTARISRLQPHDPNKAVVLVVHGLMDTPATWTPLINKLRMDERIRRNYEFWFYSYPSGYPYPYSAALLRKELDAAEKRFPSKKPMVVIGHSMGGCISRLLITDTGDKLWSKLFQRPPAQTRMDSTARQLFEDTLIFRARPEIGRVIFMAAPLRGSDIASNPIGRIGSRLVHAPLRLVRVAESALASIALQNGDLKLRTIPNSIDTLAPNNRFVRAVNTLPLKPGLPVHTIAGDRGKGGNRDHTPPVMSDGVVPFWSAYLPQAVSEKVVASGHNVHQNPEAIEEVRRILIENAR